MGSAAGERGRAASGESRHRVGITRPFAMQATEVTQGQWYALLGNHPGQAHVRPHYHRPVDSATWANAVEYLNAMSRKDGLPECYPNGVFAGLDCLGYRLPTEAEWEYAARGGTTTAFFSGNIAVGESLDCGLVAALDPVGWYCGNNQGTSIRLPVAAKRANAWGLYDMHGNVREWTNDWYAIDYGGFGDPAVPVIDPIGPPGAPNGQRVMRGGAWTSAAREVRAAARASGTPGLLTIGFRPVRTLP